MSTLRISNIEAKSVPASATVDEKVKITNSSGDTLVFIDGKTSGITTVGINTTDANITFDANSNVLVTGIITATKFSGQFEPTSVGIADSIFHTGDTNTAIRFPTNDKISFETAGSERLYIDSSGNIGIGPVSADRMLHLKGTGNAIVKMEADYSGSVTGIEGVLTASGANRYVTGVYGKVVNTSGTESNVASIRLWNQQASPTTSDSPGYITFNTTNDGASTPTEKVRIASDGNIGINNSSPSYALSVNGDTGISVTASSNSTFGQLSIVGRNNAGNVSAISRIKSHPSGSGNTSDMSFETRNSSNAMVEHLRIKSDGKVGIQTNVPSAAFLDIASSEATDSLRMRRISSDSNIASNWSMKPYAGSLFFREGGSTDKIRFSQGGNLHIQDGNLVVASGHGIDFSLTSDGASGSYLNSEVLYDYERGRFEPRFLENGTTDSNYAWRYGQYVKIGNMVHIHMAFGISSLSGNFTTAFIGGLPFSMSSQWGTNDFSYVQLIGYSYASGYGDSGNTTQISMELNQTHGTMHRVVQGQGKSNVNQSSIGSNQRFAFQFSYPAS